MHSLIDEEASFHPRALAARAIIRSSVRASAIPIGPIFDYITGAPTRVRLDPRARLTHNRQHPRHLARRHPETKREEGRSTHFALFGYSFNAPPSRLPPQATPMRVQLRPENSLRCRTELV